MADSAFDLDHFESGLRLIARTLGAALANLPQQAHLVAALADLDRDAQLERSQSLPAFLLEVLLALYHNQSRRPYVRQVTESLNALLLGRHQKLIVADRKIGEILRNQLGITPDARDNKGYRVSLTGTAASRIHDLAASHGVPRPSPPEPCRLCDDAWPVRESPQVSAAEPAQTSAWSSPMTMSQPTNWPSKTNKRLTTCMMCTTTRSTRRPSRTPG